MTVIQSIIGRIHLDKAPMRRLKVRSQGCYDGMGNVLRDNLNGKLTVIRYQDGPSKIFVPQDSKGLEIIEEMNLERLMKSFRNIANISVRVLAL